MSRKRILDDLKTAAWVIALVIVLLIYGCGGALADSLVKDYDIKWGTGDGPVGAEDPGVATGGWVNITPATPDIQAALDWLDANWAGAGAPCEWTEAGGVVSPTTATDVVEIGTTGTNNGNTLYVHRNLALAETDSPVVYIHQDNADDPEYALVVQQDGSSYGVYVTAANSYALIAESVNSYGVFGGSANAHGVFGDGGAGNDDYGIFAADDSKAGLSDTFDQWNTGTSPYGVAPPPADHRTYFLDTDYWFSLNDAGKVDGWSDRDNDTCIDVEKTADCDSLNFKTGGTERAVINATGLDVTGEVEASTRFVCNNNNGLTDTHNVVTDVDFAGQQFRYSTKVYVGGILISETDQGWTPDPLNPP